MNEDQAGEVCSSAQAGTGDVQEHGWMNAEASLTDSVHLIFSAREGMKNAQMHLWDKRTDAEIMTVELTAEALDAVATQWLTQRGYGVLPPRDRQRLEETDRAGETEKEEERC